MSSTGTSIAIIERNLAPIEGRLSAMVEAVGLEKNRFMQTMLTAFDSNPRLLEFDVREHLKFASTTACLGLEPSNPTGQIFPVPFGGRQPCIQAIVGYKGFNTVAARAGITIHGDVIREGDNFSTVLVAGKPYAVETKFGGRQSAPIIGAWAQAEMAGGQFSTPVLMDLSELNAVRGKSMAAKKKDSPWNDRDGPGFGAMCAKTAKRRLARSLPFIVTPGLERMGISQHTASMSMDQMAEEEKRHSFMDLEGQVIPGRPLDDEPTGPTDSEGSPLWRIPMNRGPDIVLQSREEWIERVKGGISRATTMSSIENTMRNFRPVFDALRDFGEVDAFMEVEAAAQAKLTELEANGC